MLVETMDNEQVKVEILTDFDSIINTHNRLVKKYGRIRFEKNINKKETYPYWFKLKSNKKNNWLVHMMKTPGDSKYDGQPEIKSTVFYLNKIGYRVFNISIDRQIRVFNGHFFHRYSQRNNIQYSNFVDIVGHFFNHNTYFPTRFKISGSSLLVITVCNSGIMLGEIQLEHGWVVYKTFIDRTLNTTEQTEIELNIIADLKNELGTDFSSNAIESDEHETPFKLAFLNQLTEKYSKS
jgi:hypothetical protein